MTKPPAPTTPLNVAVTADNYEEFLDSTVPYAPVANQLDATAHPEKTVWLDIYMRPTLPERHLPAAAAEL